MSKVFVGDPIVKNEADAAMKLNYEIPTDDFTRAGEASSAIKKVLRQIGMDADIIRKIAIATYEAEINVVIHSLGGIITVFIKGDHVEIFVEDNGPGISDIKLALTEGYSTASNKVREMGFGAGMGLPNMIKCCDEFHIESKVDCYTKIKMIMYM